MEKEIGIQIKRIKQLSFQMKEHLARGKDVPTNIALDHRIHYNLDKNYVHLFLRVTFKYEGSDDVIIETETQNVFEADDPKPFVVEGENIQLPKSALITIVSLSISHTRAFLANNVAGTMFNGLMIPILNGEEVTNFFFFSQEEPEVVEG